MFKLIVAASVIACCACGGKATKDNVETPVSDEPTKHTPPASSSKPTVDHSDPVAVVEAMFEAARTGKDDQLAGLCDPAGSGDGDSKEICALKVGAPKWDEFVKYFGKGSVVGEPTYEGDRALVDILFGENGEETENIGLIKVDGLWYLARF